MKKSLASLASVFAFVAIAFAGATAIPASAAPAGAATNLSFGSQACQSNGTITGALKWSPSGLGSQYVDLSLSAGFGNYSTGGPYGSSANAVSLVQLKPGTTYYARIRTAAGGGTLTSDVIAVTPNCSPTGGDITKPTKLTAQVRNDGSVRFGWTPGQNNIWYCLDTATDLSDLYAGRNSWRNHGCWNTDSALTVNGLACGKVYYWLLYTWNFTSNVKSDPSIVQTRSCASTISAPTNLQATRLNDGGILFDWTPGQGNIWYCLDTAKDPTELLNGTGSWRNHGCWSTDSQWTVHGLDCSQTYYWAVYSWNYDANVKSAISTVQSQACKSETELAPIVDVDVEKVGTTYRADIVAALPDGCHEPESYRVQRSGNTIQITVWNEVAPGPCTFIYSEYELNINLGSNFTTGQTYKVVVNDTTSESFVAD